MMSDPAFTPDMEKALNSYAVPPMPAGFSDRLMARVASDGSRVNKRAIFPSIYESAASNLPLSRENRLVLVAPCRLFGVFCRLTRSLYLPERA